MDSFTIDLASYAVGYCSDTFVLTINVKDINDPDRKISELTPTYSSNYILSFPKSSISNAEIAGLFYFRAIV